MAKRVQRIVGFIWFLIAAHKTKGIACERRLLKKARTSNTFLFFKKARTMLLKIYFKAIGVATLNTAFAQNRTQASSLTISGWADVNYKYDSGKSRANSLTSFAAPHNRFELGMAPVKFDCAEGRGAWVAELGFGRRVRDFSDNDAGMLAAVKQRYLSYAAPSRLKLTAGWATPSGYELVDAYANPNYSMSYMFTNGSCFRTGARAEISTGTGNRMVGIVNATHFKTVPDGYLNKKFLIAQYSFLSGDAFKAFLNCAGGQGIETSRLQQFDPTVTSKVSKKFNLASNATVASVNHCSGDSKFDGYKNWRGSAVYANFDPPDKLDFILRQEYFSDASGLKYGGRTGDGNIVATTFSAQLRSGNLMLIPEFRMDAPNQHCCQFVTRCRLPVLIHSLI